MIDVGHLPAQGRLFDLFACILCGLEQLNRRGNLYFEVLEVLINT